MSRETPPDFATEADELIESFNRDLLLAASEVRGGQEIQADTLNRLFRSIHTLKGMSGMFGLATVTELTHRAETVLDRARMGRFKINDATLDIFFSCVDALHQVIKNGETESIAPVFQQLERLVEQPNVRSSNEAPNIDPSVRSVLTEYEEHRLKENLRTGHSLYYLRATYDLANFDIGLAEIDALVKAFGEVITKLPSAVPTQPGSIAFDIMVGTKLTLEEVQAYLRDLRMEIVPANAHAAAMASTEPDLFLKQQKEAAPLALREISRTLRVDIRRLDYLMNLVGELTLTKTALHRIIENMRRDSAASGFAAELVKETRDFERRLGRLQDGIMEVRMIPLAGLFERTLRGARMAARELGKEVRVTTSGETTELDKLIVEELTDPLLHLVRNAIDHGVETPQEREVAKKHREATVQLRAVSKGNNVVIEVHDDGRGIDLKAVVAAALQRKVISGDRAAELSEKDIYALLFLPGFSTKEKASEMSGRGVGLDVVKTNIAALSGTIGIDSTVGRGTTVTMTLPMTLAIIPALLVRVAESTYALPLHSVQEAIEVKKTQVHHMQGRRVVSLREKTLPLVSLRQIFHFEKTETLTKNAVVVGFGENQGVLMIDALVGQQDIVMKSLGKRLRGLRGVVGAAELANQTPILVLDGVALVNETDSTTEFA